MTTTGWLVIAATWCILLAVAALGSLVERLRGRRMSVERILVADSAAAHALITYYNDVHDSHSG